VEFLANQICYVYDITDNVEDGGWAPTGVTKLWCGSLLHTHARTDINMYPLELLVANEMDGLKLHCSDSEYVQVPISGPPGATKSFCPMTKGEDFLDSVRAITCTRMHTHAHARAASTSTSLSLCAQVDFDKDSSCATAWCFWASTSRSSWASFVRHQKSKPHLAQSRTWFTSGFSSVPPRSLSNPRRVFSDMSTNHPDSNENSRIACANVIKKNKRNHFFSRTFHNFFCFAENFDPLNL
jgi:hypothetical protein